MNYIDLLRHLAFVRCSHSVGDITSLPRKNKQSQFTHFLKTFFLLAFVMVMGVSSAWGQTSHGKAEITSAPSSQGWFLIKNEGNVKAWSYETGTLGGYTTLDSKVYIKLNDTGYFKLRIAKGSVVAGDILRVDCAGFYNQESTLGFYVEGSNSTVSESVSARTAIIDYTLKASDIRNDADDTNYDMITIKRLSYAVCYHSFEILRTHFTVTYSANDASWGTVSAKVGSTSLPSGSSVNPGTQVTFTATPSSSNYLTWGWSGASTAYSNSTTVTVNSDISITHNFTPGIKFNAYTNDGTYGNVIITRGGQSATSFHVTPWPGEVTFKATATDNGIFEGWYSNVECTELVSTEATLTYTNADVILQNTGTVNRWAKFKEKITHPDVSCVNKTINLSKIKPFGDLTYSYSGSGSASVTINSVAHEYANGLTIEFANPQNMTHVKTITINGGIQFGDIPFSDGTNNYWPDQSFADGKTVITLNNDSRFSAIRTINLRTRNAGAQTFSISSIEIEYDHTPAKPQLIGNTTATMVIPEGKTLTLSADDKDNTFWRQYDAINSYTQITTKIPTSEYNTPVRAITGLTSGTYYFAAERGRSCETGEHWHAAEKTWVTVEVEPVGTMPTELDLIKQPIYGQNHTSMAKEYIAIANLKASNGEDVPGWGVTSVTGTDYKNTTDDKSTTDETTKQKIAYVLGGHDYKVNSENGLCISQWGRAGLIEGQAALPTRATLMFKAAGTMDFFILANNKATKVNNEENSDRRHIKVWYTNDQNLDGNGNRKLMAFKCANDNTNNDFWFNHERGEDNSNGFQPLKVGVRLQHLGADGTCNVFITYEDDAKDENVWIKGVLVKRPDLSVTIGRTDKLFYSGDTPSHNNCKVTPYGENHPYIWDLSTSGFEARNTVSSSKEQKVNEYDGRTYICGEYGGAQLMDHLLIFSDGMGDAKARFDATNGAGKEYIEFASPTKYSGTNTYDQPQSGFDQDRRSFNPILTNGLKVNVTGSGWFTISCAAPNGKVKMRVLSSTNGGNTYMNVLREFEVDQSSSNTDWKTFRVYLKAHQEKDGAQGFWDGSVKSGQIDPEQTQMSLYVVFDAISGETYTGGSAQLNIHELQWINEMPADYVFQQEEDPRLLNSLQSIVSNGTASAPGLYWQAGTDLVEAKKSLTPTGGGVYNSAYNSAGSDDRANGQHSASGSDYQWNVAAAAHTTGHTEVDYASTYGTTIDYTGFSHAYNPSLANSTEAENSHKNNEFAIPISGSFFRFMPMKNQFISAHIVPTPDKNSDSSEKTEKIYVLDETGKPIPYISGADMTNAASITTDAREHGWVSAASGATYDSADKCFNPTANTAIRIDFAALAGKEYFIVSDDGKISLARMQVTGNEAKAAMEEIDSSVTLTDGGTTNASAISTAMSGTARYASESKSITLTRTFQANKWASLVLPFSLNEKKFKEIFGDEAKCIHFTDLNVATNTVHLTHHFYEMIVAGRPVFICPSVDVTNPTFSDVTLQASTVTNTTTPHGFEFVASYDNSTINKNDLYLNNDNKIKYLTEATYYPGMRSFIKTPAYYDPATGTSSIASASTRAILVDYAGMNLTSTTGIEELIYQEFGEDAVLVTVSTPIYDVNGYVVGVGRDLESLPTGIYFVNGKKYVVK